MNLKSLSDEELIQNTKNCVHEERLSTAKVLHHLREVESRRLHLKRGYSSMLAFCMKEMNYSEDHALRRIAAARVLNQVPEIESKIEAGSLSLTSLNYAQSFFRKEKSTLSEKKEILKSIENKSTREVQRELLKLSPLPVPSEKKRQVTEDLTSLTIVLNDETMKILTELKSLFSHKNPFMNYSELIKEIAPLALETLRKKRSQVAPTAQRVATPKSNLSSELESPSRNNLNYTAESQFASRQSRYIPKPIEKAVWTRDQSRCSFQAPLTKRKCGSYFQVQVDHIVPLAAGGQTELTNLRLLCRQHNLLSAVQWFGKEKIDTHIKEIRAKK